MLLQRRLAGIEHDVGREIQHLLQRAGADLQKGAHAGRDSLEVPDVADRRGQLDMTHALAANLGLGDLDAALVAHNALIARALVFSAVALPVLGGPEDALAEQTVALRLERAVIDGFGLFYLSVRPFADLFGRREMDLNGIEIRQFKQEMSSPFSNARAVSVE